MTLICGNKKCNHKFVVKLLDVCKKKIYYHVCEKCGMSTGYDTSKLFDGQYEHWHTLFYIKSVITQKNC